MGTTNRGTKRGEDYDSELDDLDGAKEEED
jgi:hypothetical protein